jgi:hypothetical protein
MSNILWLVGALVALTIVKPFLRVIIAALFGKAVGRAALAKTADRLELRPADAGAWTDAVAAESASRTLFTRGFVDAGTHASGTTKGLVMRLFVREEDALRAAYYEHPKAGRWTELFRRYADGTSETFTSRPDPGLAPRPGHEVVRLEGAGLEAVIQRASGRRPLRATRPTRAETVAREFEADYAEGMAWRKAKGVTTKEVVAVARRDPPQPVS